MPIKILTNESLYTAQRITLVDYSVTLQFKFSERSQSWYLDILNNDGITPLLCGIKIMPNQNLTGRYRSSALTGGNFWCLRIKNDKSVIDKLNFGSTGTYSLYWLTDAEEEELLIDGQITIR